MGYMRHHAIVVTSWARFSLNEAFLRAKELGMSVTNITDETVNGYRSFLIAPDGSKEGWDASAEGDLQRAKMVAYLDSQRYEDDSSSLAWVVVQYGDEEMDTRIICDNAEHQRAKHGMPNRLAEVPMISEQKGSPNNMIELDKAHRGSYWWEKRGKVAVDSESVESIEQMYDHNAGGSTSPAYVKITMKSGVTHHVYGDYLDVSKKLFGLTEHA